jgi:hypothetical protein
MSFDVVVELAHRGHQLVLEARADQDDVRVVALSLVRAGRRRALPLGRLGVVELSDLERLALDQVMGEGASRDV